MRGRWLVGHKPALLERVHLGKNIVGDTQHTSNESADARRRARRRRWFVVVALLGSLTLSLIVAEIVLRVYVAARGWTPNCYAAHLSLFRPHPELGADLAPNFRLKSGAFSVSTNSLGLRGPEISSAKAEGMIRIAILGGSSAYGYLVNDGEEAARILEESLRDQARAVEVINAAVPGYNLFRTRIRFQQVVADLDPDIVVLYAGYNDISYLTDDDPSSERWLRHPMPPAWEQWLGHCVTYGLLRYRLVRRSSQFMTVAGSGTMTEAGQKQFRSNLDAIAREVAQVEAQLVVCSQATAAHADITQDLQARIGATDEKLRVATQTMNWIRQELQRFATTSEAGFIDISAEIPPTTKYLGDVIHLTKAGERKLGEVLTKHLLPVVDDLARPKRE